MRLFNTEFTLRLNRHEEGHFTSFRMYFRHKAKQLLLIIVIMFAVFYFSGLLSKGIDKLQNIAPATLQELNTDGD